MKNQFVFVIIFFLALIGQNNVKAQDMEEYRNFSKNCYKGNFEEVKKYVESKKSINPPTGAPFTALYMSIMKNQYEIANYLLQNGANVNIANTDKTTPLMGVFICRKSIISPFGYIKLLLKYNADVNAKDENNVSVLDLAAVSKNPEILKELINKGAKTNNLFNILLDGKTYKYSSLTWLIANFCNLDIVKLYVLKGADVNSICSVDDITMSALDFANQLAKENACYTPTVNYLKLNGAKNLYKESNGTKSLSINDIIKSIGLSSGKESSNSSNCYNYKETISTTICGIKVTAYKINCAKGENNYLIAYYPGGGKDCLFSKNKGWYSHGFGITDTQWWLITYDNIPYTEAAKRACDCEK